MNSTEELRTVTQQIEDAHQNLLSIDQQYYRVKKLHESETQQIADLQQIKADLEKAVQINKEEEERLIAHVNQLALSRNEVLTEIDQANSELISLKTGHQEIINEQGERETTLSAKEIAVSVREEKVSERENIVAGREKEAQDKHLRIKDFAKDL